MSKKKSFYENEYTRQLEEAVFDQQGYDVKKAEEKKKVQQERMRHKGLVRVFILFSLFGVLALVKYLLDTYG